MTTPALGDPLYINFTAEITPTTVERLTAVMGQAAQQGVNKVYLVFSTPGGEVRGGIALYNLLRGMPFELTIHNISSVNSIGNVIFLAGDKRYATPGATFMFHGVAFNVNGAVRVDEQYARDRLDSILADQNQMGQIITSRTTIENDKVKELFRTQRTVDTDWAKENGVIEDVRDLNIPSGSSIVPLVFQR